MGLPMQQQQTSTTITIIADSLEEFRAKAAAQNVELPPGSVGSFILEAKRIGPICPIPIGALMQTLWVGNKIASQFLTAGAEVTASGSLGGFQNCDGFIEWEIPPKFGQVANMSLGPVVIVAVVAAVAGLVLAVGWAIGKITGLFRIPVELIEAVEDLLGEGAPLIIAGIAVLVGIFLLVSRGPTR